MQQNIECPVCHEKVYSGLGEGCKMCGMILEDKTKKNKLNKKIILGNITMGVLANATRI